MTDTPPDKPPAETAAETAAETPVETPAKQPQEQVQESAAPEYTKAELAERKRRGLDKGNIGPKSKGPLPRTSPATATLMAFILMALFVVTTLWTDRNVDYWWSYIQKGTHDVPMWVSAVLTFILAPIIIFLNLGSEAFKLFIDYVD